MIIIILKNVIYIINNEYDAVFNNIHNRLRRNNTVTSAYILTKEVKIP